jgi:hypothetical protein
VKRVFLVAATISALAVGLGTAQAAPKPHPAGVDWGNSHFTEPDQLSTWLADRGVRYDDWLRRHPSGAFLMTHPAAATSDPIAPPVSRVRASGLSGAAISLIYGCAAALLLLAAIPSRLVVRVVPMRYGAALTPARTTFAAAGLSLGLGAIIASLF